MVDVRWNAVDLVIASHDAANVSFPNAGPEGDQKVLPNGSFGIVAGRSVGAALGLAVNGKVLNGGQNMIATDVEAIALKTFDRCYPHARDEIRIFAIGFFGAAPAWVAGEVKHRRENLVHAPRSCFVTSGGEDLMHQCGIPGAREADRLREAGAAVFRKAVEGFTHEERGDAQAGFFQLISLDGVAQDRRLARGDGGVRGVQSAKDSAGFLNIPYAGGVEDAIPFFRSAGDLVYFFLEGHAREQIGYPLVDCKFRIAVGRSGVRRGRFIFRKHAERAEQINSQQTGQKQEGYVESQISTRRSVWIAGRCYRALCGYVRGLWLLRDHRILLSFSNGEQNKYAEL